VKNYFAAYEGSAEVVKEYLTDVLDFRLVSYFVMRQKLYDDKILKEYRSRYTSLMLDSGAFSAEGQDRPIYIGDYIRYCIKHKDVYDYFVNLDVIPGSHDEGIVTAEESKDNYHQMLAAFKEAGIDRGRLIPVFHQYEKYDYLKEMVDDGIPYIGLSPSNKERDKGKREFLSFCAPICFEPDKKGIPKAKFHAFGLSSFPILKWCKYLFHSADAKTWAQHASNGMIYVPKKSTKACSLPKGEKLAWQDKWDFSNPRLVDIGNHAKRPAWWLKDVPTDEDRKKRHEIVEYIRDLGLHIGHSHVERKHNTSYLGEWEEELTSSAKKELKLGHEKGTTEFMWTEDFDTHKDGTIRWGLTQDIHLRMYVNIVAIRWWHALLDPTTYTGPPEPDKTEEETALQDAFFDKVVERRKKRQKAKSAPKKFTRTR